jgi:hypothetical protein
VNFLITGEGEMFLTAQLKALFPNIPPETYPLIESLEVPIMKHSLMTEYLLCKEQYKSLIDEYFKKKGKEKNRK